MTLRVTTISLKAAHAEHIGLVIYAACDTFGVHWLVGPISGWIFLCGLLVTFGEDFPGLCHRSSCNGKAR